MASALRELLPLVLHLCTGLAELLPYGGVVQIIESGYCSDLDDCREATFEECREYAVTHATDGLSHPSAVGTPDKCYAALDPAGQLIVSYNSAVRQPATSACRKICSCGPAHTPERVELPSIAAKVQATQAPTTVVITTTALPTTITSTTSLPTTITTTTVLPTTIVSTTILPTTRTTSWVFPTIITTTTGHSYFKTADNQYCKPGHDITDQTECQHAASALGLAWANAWRGEGDHKFCFFADDGRQQVFFNTAGALASPTPPYVQYASLCDETPIDHEQDYTMTFTSTNTISETTSTSYTSSTTTSTTTAGPLQAYFTLIGSGWCLGPNGERIDEPGSSWQAATVAQDGSARSCLEQCVASPGCIGYMTQDMDKCDMIMSFDTNAQHGIVRVDHSRRYFCWKREDMKQPCQFVINNNLAYQGVYVTNESYNGRPLYHLLNDCTKVFQYGSCGCGGCAYDLCTRSSCSGPSSCQCSIGRDATGKGPEYAPFALSGWAGGPWGSVTACSAQTARVPFTTTWTSSTSTTSTITSSTSSTTTRTKTSSTSTTTTIITASATSSTTSTSFTTTATTTAFTHMDPDLCTDYVGKKWSLLGIAGEGRTVTADAEACRDRCLSIPGCIGSSWWGDGGCHLSGNNASLVVDLGAHAYSCGGPVPTTPMPDPRMVCARRSGKKWDTLDMPGEGRTMTSDAEECRDRCRAVPDCIGSSWWNDGGCHLGGSGALLIDDSSADSYSCEKQAPTTLPYVSGFNRLAVGGYHSCAIIQSNSSVACWGYDSYGQTKVPRSLDAVSDVAAGDYHTCAISQSDSALTCWGYNAYGQTEVPGGLGAISVANLGGMHTCAIRKAGNSLVCWGYNAHGQATLPAGLGAISAVALGGMHTCAIREHNRSLVCWGYNSFRQAEVPSSLGAVLAVAASGYHTCAISQFSHSLTCWGYNPFGPAVPNGLGAVSAVATGGMHVCAILKPNASLTCWGSDTYGQTTVPSSLGRISTVAAGGHHTCAMRESDGDIACWGSSYYGQTNVPSSARATLDQSHDGGRATATIKGISGGTTVYVPSCCVVLFGGADSSGTPNNGVWKFYPEHQLLERIAARRLSRGVAGGIPAARSGHTAIFVDEPSDSTITGMYVFGGRDVDGKALDDLWKYDHATNAWTDLSWSLALDRRLSDNSEEAPRGRFDHAAVYYNKGMYIFGGLTGDDASNVGGNLADNGLWKFDLAAKTWEKLAVSGPGVAPFQRHGHAAVYSAESAFPGMYFFGGKDASGYLFDAIRVELSRTPVQWSVVIDTSSNGPDKRSGHSAVYIADPRNASGVYIFGGQTDPDPGSTDPKVLSDVWYSTLNGGIYPGQVAFNKLDANSDPTPQPRTGHTAVYDTTGTKAMFVFGGHKSDGAASNGIFKLDLQKGKRNEFAWSLVQPNTHTRVLLDESVDKHKIVAFLMRTSHGLMVTTLARLPHVSYWSLIVGSVASGVFAMTVIMLCSKRWQPGDRALMLSSPKEWMKQPGVLDDGVSTPLVCSE